MAPIFEQLKNAPTHAHQVKDVEELLCGYLKLQTSEASVAAWMRCVKGSHPPNAAALQAEQSKFAALKVQLDNIQSKAGLPSFEQVDLTKPFGSRLAPVSGTLFWPTLHTSDSIVTMEKFTPRSLIRKGFPAPRTFLYNTFPIKRDENIVKNRTPQPPAFGLPAETESSLVEACYESSRQILLERAEFPSFNLIFGAGNRDGVLRPVIQTLRAMSDRQVHEGVLSLPSIEWPERKIGSEETNQIRMYAVTVNNNLTAVYVELCHPSDGMVSKRRTSKLWHDGCALDAFVNLAVHLAGNAIPEDWSTFYMATCHPQDIDAPPDADQWYTAERVWLNSLRGEEIKSGIKTDAEDVPLHLRQRLDAVDLTVET